MHGPSEQKHQPRDSWWTLSTDWPKNRNKWFRDLICSVPFLPAILGLSVCQGHASIAAITVLILDGT